MWNKKKKTQNKRVKPETKRNAIIKNFSFVRQSTMLSFQKNQNLKVVWMVKV